MKKSLIVSHITACDYPLWRQWIRTWGVNYFDEIIIYMDVQMRYPFYWAFVEQDLAQFPEIKFLDPVPVEKDWRATSTTELLKHATGDWIFSIEQDWVCRNWGEHFGAMSESLNNSDFFGWWNPTNNPYIHPSYFFIKRELLEKTSKDFSAHPEVNGSDHFGTVTYDVKNIGGKIMSLQDLGYTCDFSSNSNCFHLGGVNQNVLNAFTPDFEFHRPEAFSVYNYKSMTGVIPQHPRFMETMRKINEKLPPSIENLEKWGKFFET